MQQTSMPPVGSSNGDFERWLEEGLEVERLSLWELGGTAPLLGTLEDR